MSEPRSSCLCKSIRLALTSGLFLGIGAFAAPLSAQQPPESGETESADLDRVEVTGSRIKRPEFTSPAPVTTITAEEISQTGLVTLGDLLAELPQLSSTFSSQNSARFIGTAGGGFLDLRGLGTDRTLVLVNGKRHVAGSVGDSSVDVNSIPTDLIERIEISTGAQSAVYGADAVAGTVNIILRDDFNGVRTRASVGFADRATDDFHRYSAGITAGSDFMGGRGNAVMSLGWDRQNQLTAEESGGRFLKQQGFIVNPNDGDTIVDGNEIDDGVPDFLFVPNRGNFSFSPGGTTFSFGLTNPAVFEPDGSLRFLDRDSFEFIEGFTQCGGANCEALDLRTFVPLQVGFERFTFDSLMTFDFTENIQGFAEVRYANVDARQQGQPSFAPSTSTITLPIFQDNAFLRDDVRQLMVENGVDTIGIRRFNTDLGLRQEGDNRETIRAVLGLRGAFQAFGRTFDYEAFGNFGRTTVERINENNLIIDNFTAAIDAVRLTEADLANQNFDASVFGGSAAVGDIVCRASLQAALGDNPILNNGSAASSFIVNNCVPLNVIGEGNGSAAAIDFVNSTAVATGEIEQFQTGFNIGSSNLVDLWGAGPIGALVGYEFRSEDAKAFEDSLSDQGATFFNDLGATNGSFDVSEVFGEVVIPLVRDVPFIKSLQIEGAGRISDYGTIGTVETWEGRFSWKPFDELTVRGTIGESIRAPTINDLFAPNSQSFANFADPCDRDQLDLGRNGRQVRIANCQALGIADPTTFVANDDSSFEVLQGGNRNLTEEESDVWTIGFVWSPSYINGLDLSVDLWDIEVSQAIAATGNAAIAQRCVDDPDGIDNQFCDLVTRGGDGNIQLIRNFQLNLNEFKSRGVDLGLNYLYNAGRFGSFNFRSNVQYLDQRVFVLNTANNIDFNEGELGDPDWEGSFSLNWRKGNLGAFSQLRVIDEQLIVDQTTLFGGPANPDPNPDVQEITKVDLEMFVDLGVNYTFPMGFTTQVTVDNVFDNVCPQVLGTCGGGGSAIFDNVGRFYNFEVVWNF